MGWKVQGQIARDGSARLLGESAKAVRMIRTQLIDSGKAGWMLLDKELIGS